MGAVLLAALLGGVPAHRTGLTDSPEPIAVEVVQMVRDTVAAMRATRPHAGTGSPAANGR